MKIKRKIAIGLSGAIVCASMGVLIGCGDDPQLEALENGTVCYALPTDGSTPKDHTAVENLGYMAYRLKNQTSYYSEMHGVVDTMVNQTVDTYKQYDDGVLITSEISVSSLVKTAKQMCFVGDHVLWREAATGASEWDGMNTSWSTEEPTHITSSDFIANYGLPATEFSVYVLNEETVLRADEVVDNGDGTYTQTYYLNPEGDKAPYYYRQQMLKTGGLDEWPSYNSITVSYTFDSTWQVLSSTIEEDYRAKMVVSVGCSTSYTTTYEYNTDKAKSDAYETYYGKYADKPAGTLPVSENPTAVGCLTQAFGNVLQGAASYDLSVDFNGSRVNALVTLDAHDTNNLDVRAKIGAVGVWFDGKDAYLSYGNLLAKAGVTDALGVVQGLLPDGIPTDSGASLDTDRLLSQLGAGSFTVTDTQATLSATLTLFGMDIPVSFAFRMDDGVASLQSLEGRIALMDGATLSVGLVPSERAVPALSAAEKQTAVDLIPYANALIDLFTQDVLEVGFEVPLEDYLLSGRISADLNNARASGTVTVTKGATIAKSLTIGLEDGVAYAAIDGIKVCGSIDEIVAFVSESVGFALTDGGTVDFGALLTTVLSDSFASLISVGEGNGTLNIAVKGTELLNALGFDFALGEVRLSVATSGVVAEVLGAKISVVAGEAFSVEKDGYIAVMPYLNALKSLFGNTVYRATVAYSSDVAGGLRISGEVLLDVNEFALAAEIAVAFGNGGATKNLTLAYADGTAYLRLDGMKVKASVSEIAALVSSALGGVSLPEFDLGSLPDALLSLDFSALIQMTEENDSLGIAVKGTELLSALGTEFALGDLEIVVSDGGISLQALGATVTLAGAEEVPALQDRDRYVDVSGLPTAVYTIVAEKKLAIESLIDVTVGAQTVSLSVKKGMISWADGLEVYLELSLNALNTRHDIIIDADKDGAAVAYGAVGASLAWSDFSTLGEALTSVYNRVAAVVNEIAGKTTMQTVQSLEGILELLGVTASMSDATDALSGLDLAGALSKLSIEAPTQQNGIVKLTFGGLSLELLFVDGSELEFQLDYVGTGVAVSADVKAARAQGEMPALPTEGMLNAEDFAEMLDYIGAAAESLLTDSASISMTGAVTNASGVRFSLSAAVDYYSGGSFPVHVDLDGKNVLLDLGLYAHVTVSLTAEEGKLDGDDHLYLDLVITDADGNDELDVFVSLSRLTENANPLKLYLPMSELMTVLSTVGAVSGIENEWLQTALLDRWLSVETTAQLRALGDSLLRTLGFGDLLGSLDLGGLLGSSAPLAEESAQAFGIFRSISVVRETAESEGRLSVTLDSSMLYGRPVESDLTVTIGKTVTAAGRGYLSFVGLQNLYTDGDSEKLDLSLTATPDSCTKTVPSLDGYYNLTGVGALIKSIAKSATYAVSDPISGEQTAHTYALNTNFYIDGNAEINILGLYSITVKIVAISVDVDETGAVGLNVRLEYDGVQELNQVSINGDTAVDLTIRDGMIYIKRTQTTYWSKSGLITSEKTYDTPVVLYRAMPLDNFASDILNQMKFVFNMGSFLTNIIDGQTGSSGSTEDSAPADYGTMVANVLKAYEYTQNGSDSWKITLNGSKISGGILNDIVVSIGTDEAGVLRDLAVVTDIYSIVTVSANLTYRNPCGVMDAGSSDATTDASLFLRETMEQTLNATDWSAVTYYEVKRATASYIGNGETVGTQEIAYDSTTGTVYSQVLEIAVPERTGYTAIGWQFPETVSGDCTVNAAYRANTYLVKATSVYSLGEYGFRYDETAGVWVAEYVYDTVLTLPVGAIFETENELKTFTDGNGAEYTQVSGITSDLSLTANWGKTDYTVTFVGRNGTVIEEATAYYGDPVVYPVAPAESGYVFEGWDCTVETVTENLTINAQYSPKVVTLALQSDIAFADGSKAIAWSSNGEDYTLPANGGYNPAGYTQFGWWLYENGAWSLVSDVTSLRYRDSLDGIEIWAAWIENVTVTVTTVKTTGLGTWATWKIEGSYTGGGIAAGKSTDVLGGLDSVSVSGEGKYRLAKSEDVSSLGLSDGDWADTIGSTFTPTAGTGGTFGKSGMTSGNAAFNGSIKYGGATVAFTYAYGDLSVTVYHGAVKSK